MNLNQYPTNVKTIVKRIMLIEKKVKVIIFSWVIFLMLNIFMVSKAEQAMTYEQLMEDYRKKINYSDLTGAEADLRELIKRYSGDIEIQSLKSNIYFMRKEYRKSIIAFNLIDTKSPEFTQKKHEIYVAYLYDTNIQLIQLDIKNKNFQKALNNLDYLLEYMPDNKELLIIKANIYYWQKRYIESKNIYEQLKDLNEEEKKKYKEIVNISKIEEVEKIIDKSPDEYEKTLELMFNQKQEVYESGYRLSMFSIKKRKFAKALNIIEILLKSYPEDLGIKELYIEALILNNYNYLAKEFIDKLDSNTLNQIKKRREDLFFNLLKDKVSLTTQYFKSDSPDYPDEKFLSIDLKKQIGQFIFNPRIDNISRFNKNDTNLSLEVNYNFGVESRRNLDVFFSYSINHNFSPVWSFNTTFYQGFNYFEVFGGYSKMNFPNFNIDILIPGIIFYLPYRLSLEEKLYVIANISSISSLTTINFAYDHHLNFIYRFAYGNSPEVIIIKNNFDILNISSYLHNAEVSYKPTPNFIMNFSGTYNSFIDRFNRYGLSLSLGYLW